MTALHQALTVTDTGPAQPASLTPNLEAAREFLAFLDPTEERFTFQTFDDSKAKKPNLARALNGTLEQHAPTLARLNEQGAGVFVTVNETDLQGREAKNITRVRAAFADTDGAPLEPIEACNLPPNGIATSSPGKWHAYWLAEGDFPLDQFKPMQKAIAARFDTDSNVNDLPRVMRLPGFYHRKDEPFLVTFETRNPFGYGADELLGEFPPAQESPKPPQGAPVALPGQLDTYTQRALDSATSTVISAPEGTRNNTLNREAVGLFGLVKAGRLPEHTAREKLERAATGVGLSAGEIAATLDSAWKAAQPREPEQRALTTLPETFEDGQPCDIERPTSAGIDLTQPPGLVGEICRLMNLTARRPRPELYPLAALHLIALVGRKRESVFTSKLNLMTLAIAPTAAGKEMPQDTVKRLAKDANCSNLIHSNSGSFKDLIYNLIDGDGSSLYIVDEAHSFLDSMKSSKAQTYESKMEAEILTMNSTALYTFRGAEKRAIQKPLEQDVAAINKKLESADGEEADILTKALAKAERRIDWLENGLPDPFFSLMGHSVPQRLDSFIRLDNIDSGFLGRTLVVRCPDTRAKLRRQPVDRHEESQCLENIMAGLTQIRRDSLTVAPDDAAEQYLNDCIDWFEDDDQLNHHIAGGIYARAPEHLYRIATILALDTGTIRLEHARYAHALVKQSIDDVSYILLKA